MRVMTLFRNSPPERRRNDQVPVRESSRYESVRRKIREKTNSRRCIHLPTYIIIVILFFFPINKPDGHRTRKIAVACTRFVLRIT